MSEKINIKILPVLAPENTGAEGGRLVYNSENIKAHRLNIAQEPAAWKNFIDSEPGTPEEDAAAKKLAEILLGSTALQIEHGVKNETELSRQASWLTQQSIEIYGEQDPEDTKQVMGADLAFFESHLGNDVVDQAELSDLIASYQAFGMTAETKQNSGELLTPEDVAFKQELEHRYGFITDHFETDKMYTTEELISIADTVLDQMRAEDTGWLEWKIVQKADGSMAVDTKEKEVKIGVKRAASLGGEAAASLTHEIIDHGLRSVNGTKTGDYDAQHGMPGYLDFEEGLGCYMEYVMTGKVPAKIANRQITASLALGQLGEGSALDRNQIFELLKKRTNVYLQAEGITDESIISAKVKELRTLIVDRFFRGGRGVEPLRSVYTKDIVYAKGFALARDYVRDSINSGVSPDKLFDFLMSAKFDATNPDNIQRLKKLGISL